MKVYSGEQAILALLSESERFDLVLLDRMMPGIDGIEVLKKIKQDSKLQTLPVILQTAASSPEQVAEGLQHGAFYYLPKPFDEKVLRAVIQTALRDRFVREGEMQELMATTETLKLLQNGEFTYRTIEQARALGVLLGNLCPVPQTASLGLTELLLNAVEHGNLGISYDAKTQLINDNLLHQEIQHRLALPEYKDRIVIVKFSRTASDIKFLIEDQGNGFEWGRFLELDIDRLMHNHGRGIAMSKRLSFTELEYFEPGNRVQAMIAL